MDFAFACRECRKTFTEPHERLFGTMTVDEDKTLLAIQLLVEGNSIRSTERITGIDRNTIMRVLCVAGEKCERLMSERIQNLRVEHLELDEVWTYVGCHQKRIRPEMDEPYLKGDQYTFIALDQKRRWLWRGTSGSAMESPPSGSLRKSDTRRLPSGCSM